MCLRGRYSAVPAGSLPNCSLCLTTWSEQYWPAGEGQGSFAIPCRPELGAGPAEHHSVCAATLCILAMMTLTKAPAEPPSRGRGPSDRIRPISGYQHFDCLTAL